LNTTQIDIKKLSETAKIPTKGSDHAAGYDLYSDIEVTIYPGATQNIPTNTAIAIPENYFGAIYARSGLATLYGLRPANCTGVIDSDYRGNIIVALRNESNATYFVAKGERIAQLIIQPYTEIFFQEVETLNETKRNDGGFGSTGEY
jgi:dUTP pyrophosphatase